MYTGQWYSSMSRKNREEAVQDCICRRCPGSATGRSPPLSCQHPLPSSVRRRVTHTHTHHHLMCLRMYVHGTMVQQHQSRIGAAPRLVRQSSEYTYTYSSKLPVRPVCPVRRHAAYLVRQSVKVQQHQCCLSVVPVRPVRRHAAYLVRQSLSAVPIKVSHHVKKPDMLTLGFSWCRSWNVAVSMQDSTGESNHAA